jgi:hypothetical protein
MNFGPHLQKYNIVTNNCDVCQNKVDMLDLMLIFCSCLPKIETTIWMGCKLTSLEKKSNKTLVFNEQLPLKSGEASFTN